MFYILNKDGQPLMPSKRYRHIKNLIKSGLAKKISSKPFTVQLLYDCPNGKQNLVLGIDPDVLILGRLLFGKQENQYSVCKLLPEIKIFLNSWQKELFLERLIEI